MGGHTAEYCGDKKCINNIIYCNKSKNPVDIDIFT